MRTGVRTTEEIMKRKTGQPKTRSWVAIAAHQRTGAGTHGNIHWTTGRIEAEHVGSAEFWPSDGGIFNYHPRDGYLEEVST